jgi:superfamily II DNA or RNA helicase
MVTVSFVSGTLDLRGVPEGTALPGAAWDPRTRSHRAPAHAYAEVLRALARAKIPFEDKARAYTELELAPRVHREPRPYQVEAIEAWERARGRGVVVLPTGAGKTHVAVLALGLKPRSCLVVAPTLDLVRQWYDLFRTTFGVEVGVVGGGSHEVLPLTVTTYDSAYLHMEHYGARFGLVVFDECHHLPSEAYAHAARSCLAPYRLGLTATPERTDGREAILDELVGPCVFRKDIGELTGSFLSEYDTDTIYVELTPQERAAHDTARATYRAFVVSQGIRMSSPEGWGEFIKRSARSAEGRRAMDAYREQRRLAFAAPAKLDMLAQLLDGASSCP